MFVYILVAGKVKQKDEGVIYKLLALLLLFWAIICWGILLTVMKAGYMGRCLEDCLTQANLAALVVDPYHYGSTGELVFENVNTVKDIFEEALYKGLGSEENQKKLGITGKAEVEDFRIYEVTAQGISEFIFDRNDNFSTRLYSGNEVVQAPDGTRIEHSAVYAKIAVPAQFLFGVEVTARKEHCADIVSEEVDYE